MTKTIAHRSPKRYLFIGFGLLLLGCLFTVFGISEENMELVVKAVVFLLAFVFLLGGYLLVQLFFKERNAGEIRLEQQEIVLDVYSDKSISISLKNIDFVHYEKYDGINGWIEIHQKNTKHPRIIEQQWISKNKRKEILVWFKEKGVKVV